MRASKVASSCRPVHGTRPPLEPGGVGGMGLPHRHGRRAVGRSAAGAIAFSGPEGRSEERTPRNRPRPVASVTSSGWGRSVDGPGSADWGERPGPVPSAWPAYSGRTAVPASLVPVTRTDPPSRLPVTAADPVGSVPDARPSRWRRLRHRLAIDPTPPPDSTLARPVLRNEVLLVLAVSLGASAVYAVLVAAAQAARADPALAEPGHAQRLGGAQPGLARPRLPAGRHRVRRGAGAARAVPAGPGPDPARRHRRRRHPAPAGTSAAGRCWPR